MNSMTNCESLNRKARGSQTMLMLAAWAALLTLAVLALPGCNTVEGVGEDIERGGQKLQNAAD